MSSHPEFLVSVIFCIICYIIQGMPQEICIVGRGSFVIPGTEEK